MGSPVVLPPVSGHEGVQSPHGVPAGASLALSGAQSCFLGGGPAQSSSRPPPLRARQPGGVGVPGPGAPEAEPFSAPARSFTLSLVDEAARVPVALRASFADRTLAWVSPWGRKQLILAPFLFYPQRFFEVGQSQARPPGDTEQGCVPGGPPCQGSPPCTVARGPMGGGGPGTSIEGSSSWYSCWK